MSKKDMFGDFDPYDMLIVLQDRINVIENAHNNLAMAYNQQRKDMDLVLESIQTLQRAHLNLSQQVSSLTVVYDPTPHKLP